MICNKNDVKKTCNNEKNTNRFDIFLAQISATGTFKATKVNAVGIDFPNKSAIISTSKAIPINPPDNKCAGLTNVLVVAAIISEEQKTHPKLIKSLFFIFFIIFLPKFHYIVLF